MTGSASAAGARPEDPAAGPYPPPPPMPARTARETVRHGARRDALRWGLCCAVIVAAHAGAALALLHYMQPPSDSSYVAGAAVVVIDLPAMPSAIPTPQKDAPPGPDEPPSPEMPKPKEETKPPEQMAEVALPTPEPPKPEPPAEFKPEAAPPPVMALPTEAPSTAGVDTPQPPSSAVLRWQSGLSAQIARFKRYPPKADARREQGTATVNFRIDDDGRVTESRIVQSSGWPHLDEDALLTVARAQPFPKPPPDTKPIEHWITFRYNFELPK